MSASLILVDERNAPLGTATWEEAHASPGKLHRAFSVYIFRKNGEEILIQRRSSSKLFAGLWANSCCSHPRENEETLEAAFRRLKEELGFDCTLSAKGAFTYQADDPRGSGSEHEHVTILRGDLHEDVTVRPNAEEIAEWKWMNLQELRQDMAKHPDRYAPWFHIGLSHALASR